MKFVSQRDFWHNSLLGHSISFQRGVPIEVPRALHEEVMEKGAIPVEDDGQPVAPEKTDLGVKKAVVVLAPDDQFERDDKILEVISAMAKRSSAKDFTGAGHPRAQAVASVLRWAVDQKEVSAVWEKNRRDIIEKKDKGEL